MPPSSDARYQLSPVLIGQLNQQLSELHGDLSPESAAVRLRAIGFSLGAVAPRPLLVTAAVIAIAAIIEHDRERESPR